MAGFKEIYLYIRDVEVTSDLKIKVCSLEGIILLKLISNADRPELTKDISDIEHIITVYLELNDGQIYKDHFDLMETYSREYLQLVSAHVIGRKIKGFFSLEKRVKLILINRPTSLWIAMLKGLQD